MAWTSRPKDLSTTATTPHASSKPSILGRAPGVRKINFTPAEFFGAAARCSYVHIINPALVTPESIMVKGLVEQHVDNKSPDFAVLKSADRLKDYMKSSFAGTVASGLGYLAMIADGYVWSDHFENVKGGNRSSKRSPDFIFARPGQRDAALMESKGTRSANAKTFDATVEDGYVSQVEPHLGHVVGTATATHGYCIGSWLTSRTKAKLNIHHTDAVAVVRPGRRPRGSIRAIQKHNYATAFRLAHSEELSRQMRNDRIEQEEVRFFQFEWLGRKWLTSFMLDTLLDRRHHNFWIERLRRRRDWRKDWLDGNRFREPDFAVEESCAVGVLRALSNDRRDDKQFDINPLPNELCQNARSGEGSAAIFPDGLAVSYNDFSANKCRIAVWRRKQGFLQVYNY
jgi:hypothetical protein